MTTRLPCHFLPGLQAVDPVCGELALLTTSCTLNPGLVTCPRCQHILMQHDRPGKAAQTVVPLPRAREEDDLLRSVRTAARNAGYMTYHTYRSERSEPGWFDLVLARPGSPLILAELKSMKGKLTPAQRRWYDTVSQATGVEVHLWRPSDLPDIVTYLQRLEGV